MARYHGIYYTIDEQRFTAIAEAVAAARGATDDLGLQQAQVATEQIALNSDWAEGDEHQEWMDNGSIAEITDWVVDLVRDWADADFEDRH